MPTLIAINSRTVSQIYPDQACRDGQLSMEKRLCGTIGIMLILGVIADLGYVALTCDGDRLPCTDFSVSHPLLALLLIVGAVLAGCRLFWDEFKNSPLEKPLRSLSRISDHLPFG